MKIRLHIIFKIVIPIIIVLLSFLMPFFFYKISLVLITMLQIDANGIEDILQKNKYLKWIMGFVFGYLVLILIRNNNKDRIFNDSNVYFNPYFPRLYLYIAAKILGYSKISLINMPIYLHYLICFKGHFQNIEYAETEVIEKDLKCEILRDNGHGSIVNLIIKDTYDIELTYLPDDVKLYPTIIIDNTNNTEGQRIFNKSTAKVLKAQIDKLSRKYNTANIFATTNTRSSYEIINYCFKNGGRKGFKHLYVYKQEATDWSFKKRKKVY